MPINLGELLFKENMVTPQQLREALSHQKLNGGKLAKAFVTLGYVKDEEITSLLSRQYGVPSIHLDQFEVDPAIIKIIPAETARKYQILPLSRSGATLTIAMGDPTNVFAMDDIKFMTGYNVEPAVASEATVERMIEKYYGETRSLDLRRGAPDVGAAHGALEELLAEPGLTADDLASAGLSEVDEGALSHATMAAPSDREVIDLDGLRPRYAAHPVARLASRLLVEGFKRGASDIHVEPDERRLRVRFRVDGHLQNGPTLARGLREPLASRLKTLARMDVRDRRRPQRGHIALRISLEDRYQDLDLRVSCLPTRWGETIALRLLDTSTLVADLTLLGFEPDPLARLDSTLATRRGLVVIAGPAGSGRTTTLYSALAGLRRRGSSIATLEDSPAFSLPGLEPLALRPDLGYDLEAGLWVGLNRDTDVVALDPLDDKVLVEVLRMGAGTGRLLLGTVLEEDAASALATVAERSGKPAEAARAVRMVVAQRLVRRLCVSCKGEVPEPPAAALVEAGLAVDEVGTFKLYRANGCRHCGGTGYRGRIGLFEVLEVSEGIRRLVGAGTAAGGIRKAAIEEGLLTLRRSGLEKIRAGVTTLDEVLRHTQR